MNRLAVCLFASSIMATPALSQDWTGFYAGLGVSYDAFEMNDLTYGDGPVDLNGAGLGLFTGYNFQSGNMVYGAEFTATKHTGEGDDGDYLRPASALSSLGLRGRIGFANGNMMPYLAIGMTRTKVEADHEGLGNPGDVWDDTAHGTSVALGMDWSLGDASFMRVEVERTNYSDDQIDFYNSDIHDYTLDATRISLGYAFRF